jgi:hypothetical protein
VSTMLTVPGGYVAYLRSGIFGEWGFAAEELSVLALGFGSSAPHGYGEPLETFDAARALLDTIGWTDENQQSDVDIDLGSYPLLVLNALKHEYAALLAQFQELPKTTSKEVSDFAAARVAALDDFVKAVETQVERLPIGPPKEPARRFAPVSTIGTPRRGAARKGRLRR